MTVLRLARDAWRAGMSPVRIAAANVAAAVNPMTRASSRKSTYNGSALGIMMTRER